MRTLRQCLLDADLVRLRVIARFWDVELTASRRLDVAAQLAEAMTVPETIAAAWEALPDEQRQALEALLAAGGPVPLKVFTREWGEIRAMGPGRMERERPWREPVSAVEGLWYRGFIARAFEQGTEGTYEAVFVPSELREYLVTASAPVDAIALSPILEPAYVRSAGDALLDDACTLLAYLQNERVRPQTDGTWPARSESLVIRRLRDPDHARLAFLRHLVRGLGWLRVTDSAHLRPDPGPATDWLQSPPGQQRRILAKTWRDDPTWNDLCHVPGLILEETGAWRNDPLIAREAILRYLRVCVPGAWYALDGLAGAIKRVAPDFQRPDGDYTTWYVRDAATGAYLSGFESWDGVEGSLIRFLLAGPLAWLGLIDLGAVIPGAPPAAFRLTPAGVAFLGLATAQPELEPGPLTLRRDFSVLVPIARRYERFQLARVADWVASPGLEEALYTYRLTPASLERARQQGIPVARVLEFLGRETGAPLPRSVEAALTRWDARGAEARLERAVVLRLASEELMVQAMSAPSTRRLIREQIGPRAALVRERDWLRLIAALGEMGVVPEVVDLEDALSEE
ncbi:MAG: helicase-associated domain-containing protein [Anaerolineae bacterium]|nr:helicase-associated domain-containing protein [Anaerolineae bacterium]